MVICKMLPLVVESQNALCCASLIYTQSSIRYGQKRDVEAPWQMPCQQSECDNVPLKSCRLCRESNLGTCWSNEKGSQNVPIIFPLRNMINQTAKTGKLCPLPWWTSAGPSCRCVCVDMCAQERLKLCQFQPESSFDDVCSPSANVVCLCVWQGDEGIPVWETGQWSHTAVCITMTCLEGWFFFFFLNTFSRDLDEEMPWKKNNQNRDVGCYI